MTTNYLYYGGQCACSRVIFKYGYIAHWSEFSRCRSRSTWSFITNVRSCRSARWRASAATSSSVIGCFALPAACPTCRRSPFRAHPSMIHAKVRFDIKSNQVNFQALCLLTFLIDFSSSPARRTTRNVVKLA